MWMTRDVLTVAPEMPVTEAAALLSRRHIRRLPVTASGAQGGRLLGLITVSDVLHAFPPDVNPFAADARAAARTLTTVGELLKGEPLTVAPEMPIEEAAALMRERKVGALPVVREANLVGLITESDVFRAFVSLFAAGHAGARITFESSKCPDPFRFIAERALVHGVRVTSLLLSQQGAVPVCVFRIEGPGVEGIVEDLWQAGHRVLNVLAVAATPAAAR